MRKHRYPHKTVGNSEKKSCCGSEKNTALGCDCHGSEEKINAIADIRGKAGVKAFIDTRFCGANADYCKPMQECHNQAIEVIPDLSSGFGQRFAVNEAKCDGCGSCVDFCCGNCIDLKEP